MMTQASTKKALAWAAAGLLVLSLPLVAVEVGKRDPT